MFVTKLISRPNWPPAGRNYTFNHSFINSFILLLIHLSIYTFIHCFILSFIYSCIDLFILTFVHSFFNSFINPFIHSFVRSSFLSFMHVFIYSLFIHFQTSFVNMSKSISQTENVFLTNKTWKNMGGLPGLCLTVRSVIQQQQKCVHFEQIFKNLTKSSFLFLKYSIQNKTFSQIRCFQKKTRYFKNFSKKGEKSDSELIRSAFRSYGSSEMTIHGPPGCMDIYEATLIQLSNPPPPLLF